MGAVNRCGGHGRLCVPRHCAMAHPIRDDLRGGGVSVVSNCNREAYLERGLCSGSRCGFVRSNALAPCGSGRIGLPTRNVGIAVDRGRHFGHAYFHGGDGARLRGR